MEARNLRVNLCSRCGESFADGAAFCAHRVGTPSARRCIDHREMLLFGFRYSAESTWYFENGDPCWLLHLDRSDSGFACRWPAIDGPVAAPGLGSVIDSDAFAERQEGRFPAFLEASGP